MTARLPLTETDTRLTVPEGTGNKFVFVPAGTDPVTPQRLEIRVGPTTTKMAAVTAVVVDDDGVVVTAFTPSSEAELQPG